MSNSRRVDALTVFFVGTALALGGMWWLERSDLAKLEESKVAAGEFSRDHLGASCDAFAAGQEGRELVIRCSKTNDASAADAARAEAKSFSSVVLVGPTGDARRCSPVDSSKCESVELPSLPR